MRAGHSGHHGALLLMRGENGPVYQWGKAPLL